MPLPELDADRLRHIIDNTWDIIFQIDLEGRYTFVNKAGERITGYSRNELIGMHYAALTAPESLEVIRKRMNDRLQHRRLQQPFVLTMISRQGARVHLEFTTTTIRRHGKLTGIQGVARDVTQRLNAEAALRQSEQRFRETVESVPVMFFELCQNQRVRYFSRWAAELLGYRDSELLGAAASQFVHPDDRERMEQRASRALAGEPVDAAEFRILRRDGSIRHVLSSIVPIIQNEQVTGLRGSWVDITHRVDAEAALRESEQRFRDMADLLPTIICEIGLDMRFTYVNQTGLQEFGYTQAEVDQGIYMPHLVVKEDLAKAADRATAVLRGGRVEPSEYRLMTKDGRELTMMINSAPMVRHGQLVGMRASLVDITHRKKMELTLRENEERLRAIFESLDEALLALYDFDGRVTFIVCPPRLEERYAFRATSLVGRTPEEYMSVDDARQRRAQIRQTFRTGLGTRYQTRIFVPGGAFDMQVSLSPLRSPEGKIVAVVAFLRDITMEKKAAEEARVAAQRLESASEQERQRLAAELHDSVGQGLIALQLGIRGVLARSGASLEITQRSLLATSADRCEQLIREVRAICHGLYPPTLQSLGLCASLRQLARDHHGTMKVGFRCDCSRECDQCDRLTDEVAIALYRVAQEAVVNAARHSQARCVTIQILRRKERLVLRVRDNGVGFDTATTKRGIGLTSMRQRMLGVDGEFKIISGARGTVLEASLPKATAVR